MLIMELMPFVFRLEKVLTLRRDALDKARNQVIQAQKALELVINSIANTKAEITQRNQDLIDNNYAMAQDHLRVIKNLNKKLEKLEEEKKLKQSALTRAQAELLEAQKKLEALEKFKEKQAEEYKLEEARLDQIQTDEKATLKFTSQMLNQDQGF